MSVFADTSALIAVINADDDYHQAAKNSWIEIITSNERLITTNYILVETIALLQRRIGMKAVQVFVDDIQPIMSVFWVDASLHKAAMKMMLKAGKSKLSLVDCTSFACMRRLGIRKAFTLDSHFREKGFILIPA